MLCTGWKLASRNGMMDMWRNSEVVVERNSTQSCSVMVEVAKRTFNCLDLQDMRDTPIGRTKMNDPHFDAAVLGASREQQSRISLQLRDWTLLLSRVQE